jgi:hypothetical protein
MIYLGLISFRHFHHFHLERNPERPWTPIYDQRSYTNADKSGYAGALAKKLSICSYLFQR